MNSQSQPQKSCFSKSLPINKQLVTSDNNHLNPKCMYYKHCNCYEIPPNLQKYFGKTRSYFVIFHCQEDIIDESLMLNFNEGFDSNFFQKFADNTVFLYIVEQSTDGSLEQIHLIPVANSFEFGSKHYFLAKKLNILTQVVEAGELMKIDDKTLAYNDQSGTFMEFNERNMLVRKKTNVDEYFQKLAEINQVTFKKVNKPLINLVLTIEDIHFFSSIGRVFYDPDIRECNNHNWEIVGEDVLKKTSGSPLKNVLDQHFDEIIQIEEINKLLCSRHLENSTHYSRPVGNFIKEPTIEHAKDLANFWPKIIRKSEIPRDDLEIFINKYKPIIKINESEIQLTVDMFLGPSGNIFKEELPTEIKKMIE